MVSRLLIKFFKLPPKETCLKTLFGGFTVVCMHTAPVCREAGEFSYLRPLENNADAHMHGVALSVHKAPYECESRWSWKYARVPERETEILRFFVEILCGRERWFGLVGWKLASVLKGCIEVFLLFV